MIRVFRDGNTYGDSYEWKPCVVCGASGPGVVDHVVPHKGDYELFWDEFNWAKMCIRCHNAKSAREMDGDTSAPRQRGGGDASLPARVR